MRRGGKAKDGGRLEVTTDRVGKKDGYGTIQTVKQAAVFPVNVRVVRGHVPSGLTLSRQRVFNSPLLSASLRGSNCPTLISAGQTAPERRRHRISSRFVKRGLSTHSELNCREDGNVAHKDHFTSFWG